MGQLAGWTTQLLPRLRSTPNTGSICELENLKGARPAEKKPQDLYDLGQQQGIPEESGEGPVLMV